MAYCGGPSGPGYQELLRTQLELAVRDAGGGGACKRVAANASASTASFWRHLVIVNAWNEWGEQSVLEPTTQDGHLMLDHHRRTLDMLEQSLSL